MRSAYLLVSHGSSDRRHQAGLSKLADSMRHQLERMVREDIQAAASTSHGLTQFDPYPSALPSLATPHPARSLTVLSSNFPKTALPPAPIVGTATLEAAPVPLAYQIEVFARRVMAQGVRQVIIVPVFLLAGVHVKEDLPQEIKVAESRLPARLRLVCAPYLGSYAGFRSFVANRLSHLMVDRCMLLAHGSKRAAGNRSVQQLAAILGADVAFWSVPPDLESQVFTLIERGYRNIAIAPYFLFPGGITDAITHRTEALAEQLPKASIRLLAPLGVSSELGKVVSELALGTLHAIPHPAWETSRQALVESSITA